MLWRYEFRLTIMAFCVMNNAQCIDIVAFVSKSYCAIVALAFSSKNAQRWPRQGATRQESHRNRPSEMANTSAGKSRNNNELRKGMQTSEVKTTSGKEFYSRAVRQKNRHNWKRKRRNTWGNQRIWRSWLIEPRHKGSASRFCQPTYCRREPQSKFNIRRIARETGN